jgi:hypothetical protein
MKDIEKVSVEVCDIGYGMFRRWAESAPPETRPLWYKCSVAFWSRGNTHICTIRWPAFDVDIVGFDIPAQFPHDEEMDNWLTQQHLWIDEETHTQVRHDSIQPEGFVRANVPDVVDAFFDGLWTPPWNCQICRKRMAKLIKPR